MLGFRLPQGGGVAVTEHWPWRGIVTVTGRSPDGRFTTRRTFPNLIVDLGRNYVRDVLIGARTGSLQLTHVALGGPFTTLTTALTNGTAYTSLAVAAIPAGLTAGQSLTIQTQSSSQVVTVAITAASGATSISVSSFTANAAYPIGAGVMRSPIGANAALDNEQFRKAVTATLATATGAGKTTTIIAPGEANSSSFTINEIGWYAQGTATSGSGILIARVLYYRAKNSSGQESLQIDRTDQF